MSLQGSSERPPSNDLVSNVPSNLAKLRPKSSNSTISPSNTWSYHNSKAFVDDISKAINCMDTTKPYRRNILHYFDAGDEDLVRRRFDVIDVILRSICTPIEPFGIIDRACLPPWAFALQLLTMIEENIFDYTTQLEKPMKPHYPLLSIFDLPVVRRILGFCDEVLAHALLLKVGGSKDKVQHESVIDFIWLTAVLYRFDDKRFLPLPHFLPVIFSIWDQNICTTKNMYLLMEAIYALGPSPRIDIIKLPLFRNEDTTKWLNSLFPNPEGVHNGHCEWKESLARHATSLVPRLSSAHRAFDVIYPLKALERFLSVMNARDAGRFIDINQKAPVFKTASDACWRGMIEADDDNKVSSDGYRISRIMSRLLENIYLECMKHVSEVNGAKMKSQMPDHPDFGIYREISVAS